MYENIYFLFKKNTPKKFPLANLFVGIYVFSPSNSKRQGALFVSKEKCCLSSFFKCKLCLENSIKLIKKKFCDRTGENYFVTCISRNKSIIFLYSYSIKNYSLFFDILYIDVRGFRPLMPRHFNYFQLF